MRRIALGVALIVGLSFLAACAPQPGSPEDLARFSEETVISGLENPTAMEFAPDGRIFVAEKSGVIKIFHGLHDPTGTTFADLRTNVYNFWDRGLLGLALDPEFPTRPYVYVLYTYDAPPGGTAPTWNDECPTPPGPTDAGCVATGRLSRLTADGDVMAGEEHVLITDWCNQFPSHGVGDIQFGPDGALYAGSGEGANWLYADWGQAGNPCGDPPGGVGGEQTPPTAEGGALRAQDLVTSGDPVGLAGSIIRVDPDTGDALPDNPLASAADPNARRIVAYGMRNPFRFTFRPGTSELWIGDVGWSISEDIHRIEDPTARVHNLGWPCFEGDNPQPSYKAAGLNVCNLLYLFSNVHEKPFVTTSRIGPFLDGKTCGSGTTSLSGLLFYEAEAYPPGYKGMFFVADYARNCIWMMLPDAHGVPNPQAMRAFRKAFSPVDLEVGPDGFLYYVDFNGGRIRRITYSPNTPPTAVITTDVSSGAPPLTVHFDGSESHDNDAGEQLRYQWDLDGDGAFDDGTEATAVWTYETAGVYQASLKVFDNHNATNVATKTILVDVAAPIPRIDTPTSTFTWEVGSEVSFSGGATDASTGEELPASALSWTLLIHHCPEPTACHIHDVQTWDGVASGAFSAPDHDYPSHLELILTANSGGLEASESLRLYPRTTQLTIDSQPSGLEIAVGPTSDRTPFTREVIVGSQTSLSAPPTTMFDERPFQFLSWSNGQPASHLITAPSAPELFTASYASNGAFPPIANAGPDITAARASLLNIDASGSIDPEGGDLTYSWSQASGPPVFAVANGTVLTIITPNEPAVLTFSVLVRDPDGLIDTDEVVVTVE